MAARQQPGCPPRPPRQQEGAEPPDGGLSQTSGGVGAASAPPGLTGTINRMHVGLSVFSGF